MTWGRFEEERAIKRTLEMAICYSDGTWKAGFFVDVDDYGECCNGDECCHVEEEKERLEKLGSRAIFDKFPKTSGKQIVCVWLYDYPGAKINEEVAQVGDTIELTHPHSVWRGQLGIVIPRPTDAKVPERHGEVWISNLESPGGADCQIRIEYYKIVKKCEQQFAQPGDTIEVTCAGIFLSGQKLIVVSKPEEDTVSDTVEHVWARIEGDDCHPVIMSFGSYRVVEESKWRKSQKIDNLLRKQMNANLSEVFE